MKSTIIIGIMAASVFLTGCAKVDDELVARTKEGVVQSQVVGYATTGTSTTTNILLTVTEIWKGSEEASRLGITNGMQFSESNPAGRPPEGAIFVFKFNRQTLGEQKQITWVRSGRVLNMSVQEFKTKIGL